MSVEPEVGQMPAGEPPIERPVFPMRLGKIRRPSLPDDTLPRDRLFDWLAARAGRRVLYIVAEAGFGKTTLVADYLRRSRLRAFWYRLDEDDTDGLVFLRYLVASCQGVDSRVLARSASLLSESLLRPVSQDDVLDALLAEIGGLGEMASALVLDDFHVSELVPAIASIVERLIARAPSGLQVIVVSRRTPPLSVALLRASGDLCELGPEELRFSESETGRLFSDSYRHSLEPDVLHDLQTRTDGWAASLGLVKTAVDGRSPRQIRAFVRSLSGAEGNLYDYLAEEVVGDLPPDLRTFLVRTSILEDVEVETAVVASGASPADARGLLCDAQRLGLLSKSSDQRSTWRAHPLVREFLLAHLVAELGEQGVAEMHRRLAAILEPHSWRLAARHWAAAGEADEVRRVVCDATPAIIGAGDITAAEEFINRFPDARPNPWFDIIRCRRLFALGSCQAALAEARRLAEDSVGLQAATPLAQAVALTMLHLSTELDDGEMRTAAFAVLMESNDRELATIAKATEAHYKAAEGGSLESLRELLLETLRLNQERGHSRYQGISLLNLSSAYRPLGSPSAAISTGTEAIRILDTAGTRGDLAAAHTNVATGLAHLGRWGEALGHLAQAIDEQDSAVEPEVICEAAELETMYGDPSRGRILLDRAFSESERRRDDPFCRYVAARVELEHGSPERAALLLSQIEGETWVPGFRSARLSLDVQVKATTNPGDADLRNTIASASMVAQQQQAWFWWKNIRLTCALTSSNDELANHLRSLSDEDLAYLSIQAGLVVTRLADLDDIGLARIGTEASLRQTRWRWALRPVLSSAGFRPACVKRAAELLELVGDAEDVSRLASLRKKRALRLPDAGRALSRRLAPRVFVEDLGRVVVHIGDRTLPGTDVRKKVLSLLCFLLSKPQFTSTREQVLEALWPEMDPDAGANSLNQSAYFLRRVLEPDCDDDTSAGYLRSRADLIWLDSELVGSRSSECLRLIADIRGDPLPSLVAKLAESYSGRFAVDFIYDDWAASFRNALHASYLDRIERAVTHDTRIGEFDRALSLARQALRADPDADQIELCLLRLYRRTGANAAAAEQYAHYASVLRDQLGIEPPPFESL